MIAVIIPSLNEECALPGTLQRLFAQDGRYCVFVVDGGSSDRTREIAAAERRVRLLSAPRGRASQMNAGARAAAACVDEAGWLLFLHADTWLPDGAIARLNGMEDEPAIQAGGFLHRFAGCDWRLRLISALDNLRCRGSRVIYGDQAFFVRRRIFEDLGGFPDRPILEDVAFSEALQARGIRPVLLAPPVVTDPRKFLARGVWRSFADVLLIILHVQCRLPYLPRGFFEDVR